MDYRYQFDGHLREHRPSRLGQRLWWIPAGAGAAVVIADGAYLATTPSGQLSSALAIALPYVAALLFLISWAALSIADWTYPPEKHYREAHHAAAAEASAYILAGRRARGELDIPPSKETNYGEFRSWAGPSQPRSTRELGAPAMLPTVKSPDGCIQTGDLRDPGDRLAAKALAGTGSRQRHK